MTRRLADDRYSASVSIRSGRGSQTHDRVLRLLPLFNDHQSAASYAVAQGLAWVHGRGA